MTIAQRDKVNVRKLIPLFFCLLVFCVQVFAHAELQEIYPANLDVLETAPEEFLALYDEPVTPARIRLLDQNGEEVAIENIRMEDNLVRFSPVETLAEGQYILSIRGISLDAHPVASSIGFSVGNLPPPAPEISDADVTTRVLFRIVQIIHLPIVLLCIGFIFYPFLFSISVSVDTFRVESLTVLSVICITTTLLNFGIGGLLITGDGISGLLNPDTWQQASMTTLGTRSGMLIGGLTGVLLSTLLGQDVPTGRYLGLFGVLLMVFSFAASGHAAISGLIFKPVFIIHSMIAGVWFGAIVILYVMLKTETVNSLKTILIGFSEMARYFVGVLLICGLILAWHQVNSISFLFTSQYGLLLLIKIFLVILALVLAVANRWYFTPSLDEAKSTSRTRLIRSIGIETPILFLIIAMTTVLASTSPEKTFSDSNPWIITLTNSGELITELTINPLHVGHNIAEMKFFAGEDPFEPQEVEVQWLQEDAAIEPITATAISADIGHYRVNNLNFLIPGEWTIRINVLVDDFTRERLETRILVE